MTIKRLFDCLEHQLHRFPKSDMLAAKENGQWTTYSTERVVDIVNKFSAGLLELGVSARDITPESSDKIAIISNNRPEWILQILQHSKLVRYWYRYTQLPVP